MFLLNRYKFAALTTLAIGMVMVTHLATAGQRLVYPVGINDTYRFAVGTMSDARGSADSQQWIGCSTNAYPSSTTAGAFCYAVNSSGMQRSCTTYDANLVQAIRTITSESYIYFVWKSDGSGQCDYVFIENSSRWKPASVSGI
jgi:hypothetical protein